MKIFILDRRKYDIPSNPPLEFAKKMLEKVRGYDKIISIGGGSTIDVAKYISFSLDIPHKAIPTTAGTGSEVTKYAVFIENGKKFSMEDDALIPDEYELKPELLISLPSLHTVASGLDALSQAIESYWSPLSTYESKKYSRKVIQIIMNGLLASYRDPENKELRRAMLVAANYSGRAINITRTSICHAISYPLTVHYNIPHGIACASTLPIFIKLFKFKIVSAKKVKKLITDLGIDRIDILKKINKDIINESFESSRVNNTPIKLTKEEVYKILL